MSPDEFLALAGKSIIKSGLLKNTKVYGRPETLGVTLDTFFKGELENGTECPVMNVKQVTSGDSFKAYVCDYEKNEINYQVLGREAEFCFTITMNGCTFGIGSPTSDGSVLVSHGNMAQSGPTQGADQLAIGQGFHGGGTTFITPDQYLVYGSGKANITTFGLRTGTKWKFYYQRYAVIGSGKMRHLGLTEVDTNAVVG